MLSGICIRAVVDATYFSLANIKLFVYSRIIVLN